MNGIYFILAAVLGFFVTYAFLTFGRGLSFKLSVIYEYDILFALLAILTLGIVIWSSVRLVTLPNKH
ncbi:hypothetical protein [Bacillus horti]|uniref:Uncharacterized protein n=1 Tax=Caldalkalibacillus horti TaxID=77523 RepID=A0ABT9VXC3_9BACI|nr:hypothetical protein [Bacillus horti]